MATAETRSRAIKLYRSLLRVGAAMPTKNRREFIFVRTREGFRDNIEEQDPERVDFLLRLGETQLETAEHQAEHLRRLWNDENFHFPDADEAEVEKRADMISERVEAEEERALGATMKRLEERRRVMAEGRERERERERERGAKR